MFARFEIRINGFTVAYIFVVEEQYFAFALIIHKKSEILITFQHRNTYTHVLFKSLFLLKNKIEKIYPLASSNICTTKVRTANKTTTTPLNNNENQQNSDE